MEITVLLFLSSGLFLGWSLGANDAANIFGTAVGSRMIRFATAAIICAIFVVLGAVIGGAGAAHGLGKLGTVNALPGSFMVALSAAVTVYGMTKAGLPVSTTQAVVGGIVGWNLFGGFVTDMGALTKIATTWVAAPILGAIFAAILYKASIALIRWAKVHVVRLDAWTRIALVVTGAFGAYSLGANNIGNVMGVFLSSSPFNRCGRRRLVHPELHAAAVSSRWLGHWGRRVLFEDRDDDGGRQHHAGQSDRGLGRGDGPVAGPVYLLLQCLA